MSRIFWIGVALFVVTDIVVIALGDPGQLARALSGLLPRVRELVESHGVEPRPEVVQALIEVSAAKHGIASARQVREALATIG